MSLPKIIPIRLQRVVTELELNNDYDSFELLCDAVSKHQWAIDRKINSKVIGELIIYHEIVTKVVKSMVEQVDDTGSVSEMSLSSAPTVFNGPGRGRKQCPECDVYLGVRVPKCVCGHDFKNCNSKIAKKLVEPIPVKVFNEAGKGRKQCPECKIFIGVRNSQCICGHEFVKKIDTPKVKKQKEVVVVNKEVEKLKSKLRVSFNPRQLLIYAPAGSCPHKLDGTDRETVYKWAEKVRESGVIEFRFFTVAALVYFAGQYYNRFSIEHNEVQFHLQNIYANEVA